MVLPRAPGFSCLSVFTLFRRCSSSLSLASHAVRFANATTLLRHAIFGKGVLYAILVTPPPESAVSFLEAACGHDPLTTG